MKIRKAIVQHIEKVNYIIARIDHNQAMRYRSVNRGITTFALSLYSFFIKFILALYVAIFSILFFTYNYYKKIWLLKHCYKQPTDLDNKEVERKYFVYIPNTAYGQDRMAQVYEVWMDKFFNPYSMHSRLWGRRRAKEQAKNREGYDN